MQRIVMTYSTGGGYECGSYEHVMCFNYESIEAFYVHFEDALKEAKEKTDQYTSVYDKWNRSRPLDKKDKNYKKLCDEWFAKRPMGNHSDNFSFIGIEFDWRDFWVGEHLGDGCWDMPDIKEINEWFASKVENPS